ncbi:uncharacterized protein LOC121265479 [Juglans microcarpa x Juglans regia]|uniref:uncharacterized protein LOC121265479 n=1 Tax=Juglans microcarpa x Juglans regia TaxID=2249226 RepID=UPI001B7E37DB|nr:uncharacterized protein LOC121265479 [Juglans microcarpa x Juglans regia]
MASPEAIDGVTEATSEEIYGATGASDSTFPAVDTDNELNPGTDKNFEVDPTSHDVATSLETKRQVEEKKKEAKKKKDGLQTLKTTILVSVVVVAVAGMVFAVTKKLREK